MAKKRELANAGGDVMDSKDPEQITFICQRYPQISIVVKSDVGVVNGDRIERSKPHYIRFAQRAIGGVFTTSDKEEIEYLKSNHLFQKGTIFIPRKGEVLKGVPGLGANVNQGVRDSRSPVAGLDHPEPSSPADLEVSASRVP